MSLPDDFDFRAENVFLLDLVELDTTEGMVRLFLGEDGWFDDIFGNRWLGSRLIGVSEMEYSINGTAPSAELTLSFIQDPDEEDVVSAVKALGVNVIKGRPCNFYIQYLARINEMFRPVYAPQKITTREMLNVGYNFDGPQIRQLSLTVEGPFNLRSKPLAARYTTTDHSRRVGHDNPSLEFMPTNTYDEQTLFGL